MGDFVHAGAPLMERRSRGLSQEGHASGLQYLLLLLWSLYTWAGTLEVGATGSVAWYAAIILVVSTNLIGSDDQN